MLSANKSSLGRTHIEFLGMNISQGQYCPGPHIASQLLEFPDSNLTPKQVQQFLGIVNFIRDFIPRASQHTSILSQMLKKSPPPWTQSHTHAVIELKKISQLPPALTIPSDGRLILQTDASDSYWGAVLLEEKQNTRSYCGHASGPFKDSQAHYHTVYKEIIAVKNGIQKFDFYLRTQHFTVEMDNSSFPKVLEFRNKIPPSPQLLRLKDWFVRYDFTVKHVKGHHNIIADMLSRPTTVHLLSPSKKIPLLLMATSASSSANPPIGDFPPELQLSIPYGHTPSLDQITNFAKTHFPIYLTRIKAQGVHCDISNPTRPFLDPFIMPPSCYFSPDLFWYLWCLSVLHHFAFVFPLQAMSGYLHDANLHGSILWTFLQWFNPLDIWKRDILNLMGHYNLWKLNKHEAESVQCIWILHRLYGYNPHKRMLWTTNISYEWHTTYDYPKWYPKTIQKSLLNFLCNVNNDFTDDHYIIPDVPRQFGDPEDPLSVQSHMIDSQDPFTFDTWPCLICGAQDSDNEEHATCNLSSP